MIRRTAPVLLSLLMSAHILSAQTLDDAAVLAAIKAGETKQFGPLISDCTATVGFGEGMAAHLSGGIQYTGAFDVVLATNVGRIAALAAQAKRLYQPFGLDQVPARLRQPGVYVWAEPQKPSSSQGMTSVAAPIERIVLKSKPRPDVIVQPETIDTEPVEWTNLMGAAITGNRAVATFPFAAIRELPAGDVDIVLVTAVGERRCKVGTKDRARLFGGRR